MESERTMRYEKDRNVESVLAKVNERLAGLERELIAAFDGPRHPVLFVVGAPRSGTTLLVQLLLTRFELGYVDNLTARFWMAPYVGAILSQQMRDRSRPPPVGVSSDFGATAGYAGPHEFGYFWRRWFQYGMTHDRDDTQVRTADAALLRQELAALESLFERPLLLKNLACSFHIDFLAKVLPRSIFLHCRREPLYAAQSILAGRVAFHGNKEVWFSVRPAAFEQLRRLPYPQQIAGQIFATRQAIERQFEALPAARQLDIDYEAMCEAPEEELDRIASRVAENSCVLHRSQLGLPAISTMNRPSASAEDFEALRVACAAADPDAEGR